MQFLMRLCVQISFLALFLFFLLSSVMKNCLISPRHTRQPGVASVASLTCPRICVYLRTPSIFWVIIAEEIFMNSIKKTREGQLTVASVDSLPPPSWHYKIVSEGKTVSFKQCCGSGMFIPDPPGSEFSIPDPNFFHPGSASKNLSILTPKNSF
jgi:hypothetical protein